MHNIVFLTYYTHTTWNVFGSLEPVTCISFNDSHDWMSEPYYFSGRDRATMFICVCVCVNMSVTNALLDFNEIVFTRVCCKISMELFYWVTSVSWVKPFKRAVILNRYIFKELNVFRLIIFENKSHQMKNGQKLHNFNILRIYICIYLHI